MDSSLYEIIAQIIITLAGVIISAGAVYLRFRGQMLTVKASAEENRVALERAQNHESTMLVIDNDLLESE